MLTVSTVSIQLLKKQVLTYILTHQKLLGFIHD
jgi:hypothetical protein